jgi:TRAP transporter 4TM/12TM fusion protein
MLMQGYTASMAALWGIYSTVIVAVGYSAIFLAIKISKEGNLVKNVSDFVVEWFKIIIEALENGARSALGVAAACACAGIIIGVVTLSGVGLKIANAIVTLAGGQLFFTLVFTMIASILLGLGLPTTAKYIILAAMAAPAIEQAGLPLGVTMLAAHMFIMYFGVFADITPPVALVTYATAGIAKANANVASVIAVKLAAAGFIVPYVFIYSPELLMINPTWSGVLIALITTLAGICTLGFAASGFWLRNLNVFERILLFGGAVALIFPGLITDTTGAIILAAVYFSQKKWPAVV